MRGSCFCTNLVYCNDDIDAYAVNKQNSQNNYFLDYGFAFLWSKHLPIPYKKTSLLTGRQEGRSF